MGKYLGARRKLTDCWPLILVVISVVVGVSIPTSRVDASYIQNSLPVVQKTVSLTGQLVAIGATTIFTAPATGLYRVSAYQVVTTAGGAGTLATSIGWNDGNATQAVKPAADVLFITANAATQGTAYLRVASGQNITYTVTTAGIAGNPAYSLFITLERLL